MLKDVRNFMSDVEAGIKMELVEWHTRTGKYIPERLQGVRMVARTAKNSITFVNEHGDESMLYLEPDKDVRYDGEMLSVFRNGSSEASYRYRVYHGEKEVVLA